jgi:ABC-type branched-subunit amino acid transport system permease subunit
MSTTALRNGFRTGMVFTILIIFIVLIGFNVTGATLVAKLFGQQVATGALPDVSMLAVFLGLLGIFAGIGAAKAMEPDTYGDAIQAGLTAGLTIGVICGLFAYGLGTLYANGVDMRNYLPMVSPDSVKFYIFNQAPFPGSLTVFGMLAGTTLAGGLLARLFRSNARRHASGSINQGWSKILGQPLVKTLESSRVARYAGLGLILIVLAILPSQWGSYWNYVMGTVGIYVIMGLGLNIITGLAGQLVLGYVAFFAIGAYSVALLNAPQPHNLMWGFWIAALIGILLSAFAGILVGLPILSLRGDYLAIVTLGLGEIMRILLGSDALTSFTAGPHGIQGIAGPVIFGQSFSTDVDFMYLILIGVLIAIFITQRVQNSRSGRSWVSIREDETVAKATGVDTFKSKLLALALGAAFAGLGGALFAVRNQFTGPEDHSLMVSINVLALVIVGGMGSIPGIILGAFVLKGVPEILRETENYRLLIFGALLVAMMILRPEGIWPASRQRLERRAKKGAEESPGEVEEAAANKEASS